MQHFEAERVDLTNIRGITQSNTKDDKEAGSETDLENLAELVPDIKNRRAGGQEHTATAYRKRDMPQHERKRQSDEFDDSMHFMDDSGDLVGERTAPRPAGNTNVTRHDPNVSKVPSPESRVVSRPAKEIRGMNPEPGMSSSDSAKDQSYGDLDDYPDSDHVAGGEGIEVQDEEDDVPREFMNMSSAQSISTATQTHEVRMPMYLPTFKPATGCTNASDFIVRCFVARLRSGITVVKHGRSRWCKSRLRVLHIHPDGRSLSWKPAEGEPPTSRRPPKLDLSTCLEVRHAWSPDPQNPMYTGTPILRQKCEAANAHKSFALIFKTRTVDITAVTADQCKVLMEGFSALCFRLQVANMAGRTGNKKGTHQARPMPEEDGVSTTASATLTNRSTPRIGA